MSVTQEQRGRRKPQADTGPLALNAVCPYYTMFPLSFPLAHLAKVPPGAAVLDPFCGRGTTIFAARTLGLPSLGIDSNPVAVAISKAKLSRATPDKIVALAASLLKGAKADPVPEGDFWPAAFASRTLAGILKLRAGLRDCDDPAADALRGILLGALHGPRSKTKHSYFSNQMPRTFASKPAYSVRYWTEKGMTPPDVDVLSVITDKAARYFGEAAKPTRGRILLGDARTVKLPRRRFSMVVTSPPYFGMRSYVPDQWIRYWFLGGPPSPEYCQPDQIGFGSTEEFATELAKVWSNVARACVDDATLVMRFGALRSRPCDPLDIVRSSLAEADAGWRIVRTRPAGDAHAGKRQAQQMGARGQGSSAVDEYDVLCKLKR